MQHFAELIKMPVANGVMDTSITVRCRGPEWAVVR